MKKKILFSILMVFLIISGVFIYINMKFKPLSEDKRNISTSDVKMVVGLKDVANRTPIIRTYTKEEFDKMDANKIERIKEIVNGNVEGDVPALKIENGKGPIEISFEKIEDKTAIKLIPDNIPEIKISVLETLYSKEEPKEIIDSLGETQEGKYLYEIKKYLNTKDTLLDENLEFNMESMYIEVYYEIGNEKYVSIFAINTVQDKE